MRKKFGKVGGLVVVAMIAAFGFVLAGGPALADEAAVKYRQSVMKAVAAHMAATAALVKGEAGATAHLPGHADALAAMGAMAKDLFPAGSGGGDTAALPVIWEKPDDFAKVAAAFETASANLASVAGGGDMPAIAAAFGELGRTCAGCHQTFRKRN